MGNANSVENDTVLIDDEDSCLAVIGDEPNFNLDSCNFDVGAPYYVPGMCINSYTSYEPGNIEHSYPSMYQDSLDVFIDKCNQLGGVPGEWIPPHYVGSNPYGFPYYPAYPCSSDTCNKYKIHNRDEQWYDPGNCCNDIDDSCSESVEGWGCSTEGYMIPCMRSNPLGNPLNCCFNDMDGNGDSASCYSNIDGRRGTCNKCQRDITSNNDQSVPITSYNEEGAAINNQPRPCSEVNTSSTGCQDIAFSYCIGEDLPPDDTSWIYRWMDIDGNAKRYELNSPSCHYAILRNVGVPASTIAAQLTASSTGSCQPQAIVSPDSKDLIWAQRLMNTALAKYKRQGYTIPSPIGSPGYTLFQNFLKNNICCKYPIVCQQGLEAACRTQTMEGISTDNELTDWCGCYLPDAEYEEYVNNFGINKTCTPPCNRQTSIKRVSSGNVYTPCTQSVCIIDDITVNIANSTGGNINFNQFCGNCNGGSCSCVIDDSSITVADSQFGRVAINEKCGELTCIDDEGNEYPCDETYSFSPYWWSLLYVIIAIVIIIVFVALCLYLISAQSQTTTIRVRKSKTN